jgi:hypothetical protein
VGSLRDARGYPVFTLPGFANLDRAARSIANPIEGQSHASPPQAMSSNVFFIKFS